MTGRRLSTLAVLDAAAILAFAFYFRANRNWVPFMIGLLPFLLSNAIYVNEVVKAPSIQKRARAIDEEVGRIKQIALRLLIIPILYCIMLPSLIKFYGSLGWSPVVCAGFSVLLCIALISAWGGIKLLLNARAAS